MAKLTILGSGSAFMTKDRFPSSFILENGSYKLLVDCGFGATARLAEIGVDPREIDAIFISHPHPDHMGDFLNIIAARFVSNIYETKKNKNLIIIGPDEIQERMQKLREVFWPEPAENPPLEFKEGAGNYQLKSIDLRVFPINHVPWFKSVGVRIQCGKKSIIYFGDVGTRHGINDLIEKAKNADILLVEAGYPHPTSNHLTLGQTEEIVEKANIKQVILIHLKPLKNEEKRVEKFAKNKKNWTIGKNRMEIRL